MHLRFCFACFVFFCCRVCFLSSCLCVHLRLASACRVCVFVCVCVSRPRRVWCSCAHRGLSCRGGVFPYRHLVLWCGASGGVVSAAASFRFPSGFVVGGYVFLRVCFCGFCGIICLSCYQRCFPCLALFSSFLLRGFVLFPLVVPFVLFLVRLCPLVGRLSFGLCVVVMLIDTLSLFAIGLFGLLGGLTLSLLPLGAYPAHLPKLSGLSCLVRLGLLSGLLVLGGGLRCLRGLSLLFLRLPLPALSSSSRPRLSVPSSLWGFVLCLSFCLFFAGLFGLLSSCACVVSSCRSRPLSLVFLVGFGLLSWLLLGRRFLVSRLLFRFPPFLSFGGLLLWGGLCLLFGF